MASSSETIRKKPNHSLKPQRLSLRPVHLRALLSPLLALGLLLLGGPLQAAASSSLTASRGSTAGLLTPAPVWSLGAQVGNYGGTGLSLQRLGVPGSGALNLNLGIESGSLGASGDYIFFASDQFHLLQLKPNSDYNALRGQLLLYFGGGLGIQGGAWVRVPVGVQYTMLRDPFTFYGGFALALGPFMAQGGLSPEAWLSLGLRLLL